MRREKKQGGASLDSLLDTMTNVVGILVILLTVTQLGVSDAVKRISTTSTIKPEQIDEAQRRFKDLYSLYIQLKERLEALLEQGDDEEVAAKLRRLKKEIEDCEANIAVLMENREARKAKAELELKALRDEIQQVLDKQKREAEEKLAKRAKIADEVASLKAQLAQTHVPEALPAKIVNLPNPRPAPEGTQPKTFLCRGGRVMFVDVEGIREVAQKRTMFIIRRRKLGRDPAAGIDGKLLADEFNSDPVNDRDRSFDVQMIIAGRVPKLVLKRREDAGETAEEVTRASSRYQREIKRTDPDEFYLQFLVWPDSFEAYLEARKLSSKRGLLAGWQAQTTSGEYTIDLGGDLRVGPPPPPPKPKPKPKPGEEPPKPKPKPAAPPKPVPVDVID